MKSLSVCECMSRVRKKEARVSESNHTQGAETKRSVKHYVTVHLQIYSTG